MRFAKLFRFYIDNRSDFLLNVFISREIFSKIGFQEKNSKFVFNTLKYIKNIEKYKNKYALNNVICLKKTYEVL